MTSGAAAEGINLQFCWVMVSYDVPWNPARLEQRMGRIHRYGQRPDPVVILNLVAPATREGRVLHTLLDKLEKIRKQLRSDKVFDSIGRIFSEVSIKQYMEMAVVGDPEEVAREMPRLRESLDQETFFRLLPGYVRSFVASAAPQVGITVDGDRGERFTLRPQTRGALDPLLPALETYPPGQRACLSVARAEDGTSCVWLHPGEPVFECLRELVKSRLGREGLRGAVFVDPTATASYLFHLARLTVMRLADPEMPELAHPETRECRLVGARQPEGADLSLCPVEHLLLLRGGEGLSPAAQRLAVAAVGAEVLAANSRDFEAQLVSLRLAHPCVPRVPTVLGLLVAGHRPTSYLPMAFLTFVRFAGTSLAEPIVSSHELRYPIHRLVPQVDERLNLHVMTRLDITSASTELPFPDYPVPALQQIVRNAILHRTYEGTNAPVRIYWYSDRIEVISPGDPYGSVTPENFGEPGINDYRNPNLAEAMHHLGHIQRFGVGIQIARDALRRNGNPPLEFRVEPYAVFATIQAKRPK